MANTSKVLRRSSIQGPRHDAIRTTHHHGKLNSSIDDIPALVEQAPEFKKIPAWGGMVGQVCRQLERGIELHDRIGSLDELTCGENKTETQTLSKCSASVALSRT